MASLPPIHIERSSRKAIFLSIAVRTLTAAGSLVKARLLLKSVNPIWLEQPFTNSAFAELVSVLGDVVSTEQYQTTSLAAGELLFHSLLGASKFFSTQDAVFR